MRSGQGVSGAFRFSRPLRVAAGALRGRRLCLPPVHIRPSMQKVKLALFNFARDIGALAVGRDISVLDLFCGTGALGFEALSRGATACTFVDTSTQCLQEFLASPGLFGVSDKFDIAMASPPYEEIVYSDLLEEVGHLRGVKTRRYGRTVAALYLFSPTAEFSPLVERARAQFARPNVGDVKRAVEKFKKENPPEAYEI